MGMDISGAMLLGAKGSKIREAGKIDLDKEEEEFLEGNPDGEFDYDGRLAELGFSVCCPYYDCGDWEEWDIGYRFAKVDVGDLDIFVAEVREKAKKFEDITGVEPRLYGTQDVW